MRSPRSALIAPERASGVRPLPAAEPHSDAFDAITRMRAEVTRQVREAGPCDVGLLVVVGRTEDGLRVLDFQVDAEPDEAARVVHALERHPLVDRELGAFPSAWKASFVSRARVLRARRQPEPEAPATDPLGAGLAVSDWAGLWVCAGRQLVAWVGGLRTRDARPFGSTALRGLGRIVPSAYACVLEAHALFSKAHADRGDVFLAADGQVLCASAAGRRWLDLPGNGSALSGVVGRMSAEGLERLEVPVRGGTARLVHLAGSAAEGYLAELAPPCLVEYAATSDLTPAQLRVAALAAHGASAQQIATALGSTEGTVRVHLRDTFRRLGVASRLELARVLGT